MAVEKIFRIKIDGKDEFVDLDKYISDAEESGKGLKTQLREINQALGQLDETSDEFVKASQKAGELRDRIGDINQTVNALASDTFQLDGFIGVANGITSAFAGTAVAMDIFGIQNERLNKVMEKTQQLLVLLNSLQSIQQLLQRQSTANIFLNNLAQGVNNSLKITDNIQTAINTGLKSKNIIVTNAAALAQRALNAAMAANPMGLLIAGVAALTGAYMLLGDEVDETREKEEEKYAFEEFAINQTLTLLNKLSIEKQKMLLDEAEGYENVTVAIKKYYDELERGQDLGINEKELELLKVQQEATTIKAKQAAIEILLVSNVQQYGVIMGNILNFTKGITQAKWDELEIEKQKNREIAKNLLSEIDLLKVQKEKTKLEERDKLIEALSKEGDRRLALLEVAKAGLIVSLDEKLNVESLMMAYEEFWRVRDRQLEDEAIAEAKKLDLYKKENDLLKLKQAILATTFDEEKDGSEEVIKSIEDRKRKLEEEKQARINYINAVQETVNQSIMLLNQFTQIAIDSQNARLENQIANVEEMKAMIQVEIDNINTLIQDSANRQLGIENALKNARGLRREALLNDLAIEKKAQEKAEKERVKLENDKLKKDEEIAKKRQAIEKNNALGVLVSASAQAALSIGTIAAQAAKQDFTFGIATVAAIGAVLASVTSAIVAAKNLSKFEKGGIIDGPSHAEGGVKIMGGTAEVEGGELIVNKNIWSRPSFVRAISEMNAQTGGKRFYVQGGILEPNFSNINSSLQSNEISMLRADILALSNRPIYTSITDINNANSRINKINDSVLI